MADDTIPMLRCIECMWHVQEQIAALAHTDAHPSGDDRWTGVLYRLTP